MSSRTCMLMLMLGLMAASAWGAGVFGYLGYYNLSGKYQGLAVSFKEPVGLMMSDGLIYVTDSGAKAVWVINASDAVVNRIPSGSGDMLDTPMSTMISGGATYIADAGRGGVIVYTGSVNTLAIGPSITERRTPFGVWVENNTMWILDNGQGQVMEYDLTSGKDVKNRFGTGAGTGKLSDPRSLWADAGHFYIADTGNNRIEIFDRSWDYADTIGTGKGGLMLSRPNGVTGDGSRIYIADTANSRIVVAGPDGYPLETLGDANGTALQTPRGVWVANGILYVLDTDAKKVYYYSMNWSANMPAVLAEIDSLNRSVTQHETNVLDVMDSINLSHAPLQAPTLIAQAAQLAQSGKYLEASSKLAAARAELDAVQLQQAQALRVELQKRIDNMLAELEPFRDASVPSEIAYQRTVVYNRIASAQDHLDSSDYAGAATMIGAAGNDTQDLIVRLDAWANGQNTTARPAQAMDAQLKAKAANLSAQWAVLNLQAQILGDYNTSQSLKTLIDSGASLADVGAYMDANRTLTDAENRLAQWQSSLEQMNVTAQMAQNASLVIGNASQMVSQNIAAWQAAGLNTQAISDKLAQAQALVGSQPEQARTLALQVIEMAKMENDKMASSSSVYGWLGLAIGAVAVVGIGVWMLVKSRSGKKKGWGG